MRINEIRCDCCGRVILNSEAGLYQLTFKSPGGIAWKMADTIDLCQNCESLFHPTKILKQFKDNMEKETNFGN